MEIPKTPIQTSSISSGFLPDVALHSHGELKVQEPSYSMISFAAIMFLIAVGCCFIPWEERAFRGNGPKVIYFIAGGFAWGGICVLIAYAVCKQMRQKIIIDLSQRTLQIQGEWSPINITLENVIGVQICRGENSSFQANLVYQTDAGEIQRHCLFSHGAKSHCLRLAKSYHKQCGFETIDHT